MAQQSVWREKIDFRHRYVVEDVACGLALWWSLGRKVGVPTPLSDVFLTLASTVNDEDYRATGRTLGNLGLANLSVDELRERLRRG
jgi:opine dehydrogenase